MTEDQRQSVIDRLRGSYKSLHGVVVVSPRLLQEAAELLEQVPDSQTILDEDMVDVYGNILDHPKDV